MSLLKIGASALFAASLLASTAMANEAVQVTGSSTVLPFSTIAAESFGESTSFKTPIVEGGGTGAGIKKFCEGVGVGQADIAQASRKISAKELKECKANGVDGVFEIKIGFDGIVFASDINGPAFKFTPSNWYNALAAEVVVDGKLVPNPYTKWSEVDAGLPDQEILALIPGAKHGTREVFNLRVLEAGCKMFKSDAVISKANGGDKAKTSETCMNVRQDGRVVEIDGDYTETLARLKANPQSMGVFGLSFYENNKDTLQVAKFQGTIPSRATIASGEYNVSRPLFIYVKEQHVGVTPGLKEFAEFFVSDDMAAEGGKLETYGLVPDPKLSATQSAIASKL